MAADIERSAQAVWSGDLKSGQGRFSAASGVLKDTPYSFKTRFEQEPGTNPEELIAAAHAACYSMALAHTLSSKGHAPQRVETRAVCSLSAKEGGGFEVSRIRLETRGQVSGLDAATFQQIAEEAEKACPVSNALRGGVKIELNASLM